MNMQRSNDSVEQFGDPDDCLGDSETPFGSIGEDAVARLQPLPSFNEATGVRKIPNEFGGGRPKGESRKIQI